MPALLCHLHEHQTTAGEGFGFIVHTNKGKKLPVEERLEIIDEIWETCEAESPDPVYEDDEKLKSVLEERVTDYESGKMRAIP